MRRAIVYIDSRNIAHLFEKNGIDPYNFNYRSWAQDLAVGARTDLKTIEAIKFFCAHYPANVDINKHNRDKKLYDHLSNQQNIEVLLGHFKIDKATKKVQEKGVDVRLAIQLVVDAMGNLFDDAYIFSTDTDITHAVRECKKLFPTKNIFV